MAKDKEIKINTGKIKEFMLNERNILIGLFLLTIIIRILYKNAGVYHWDSLRDLVSVQDTLATGELKYSYAYGAPGMIVLILFFYFFDHIITGTNSAEFAYFFVTFVTSGLCVMLVYLITQKYTRKKFISITSALLLCFTPIFLSVTTYPKTHSISLFFALMSIYLLMLFNEKNKAWMLALSGFCLGYSVSIRIFSVLFLLPLLYIYIEPKIKNGSLKINKEKFNIKNFLIFSIPSAAIWFLLFLKMIINQGGIKGFIKFLFVEQSAAVGWQGVFSPILGRSISGLITTMTWLGVILLFLGLLYCYKTDKDLMIMMALWIIPPFIYFANIAAMQFRFFITFLPVLMILIAMGCYVVYTKKKIAGIIVVIIILGMMFFSVHPIIKFRHDYSGTRATAEWISSVTEPNAIIMSNDFGLFINHYGDRETIIHPRTGNDADVQAFMDKIIDLSRNGVPFYSTGEGFAIDPGQKVQNSIVQNFDVYLVGEKMNEVYQYSELELRQYNEKLFRLVPKNVTG